VTSASMMVNTPGFTDAVRRVAAHPALSVGLHLNLTVGPPVADPAVVTSLLDAGSGHFLPLGQFIRRALSGRVRAEHVIRECEAQIDRLRAAGIGITHLDSHRHMHALPGLLEPVVAATRRAGIRALRRPIEPMGRHPRRIPATVKKLALLAGWRDGRFPPDLAGADHFRGLSCRTGAHFESDLLEVLDELTPGTTELMVHPGHADPALDLWDSYAEGRETELAALCSTRVQQRLRRGDISLVSFPIS
jgi:predicted glycoside hydrolase/deacetylase ChbG (UPF0249 family)